MAPPTLHGPEPITLEGRQGMLYRLCRPGKITGLEDLDQTLTSFPLTVFQPQGRDPASTPILIGLQGIAAPYQWNSFLVPTLLDMGIACALLDTPLGGEHGLAPDHP